MELLYYVEVAGSLNFLSVHKDTLCNKVNREVNLPGVRPPGATLQKTKSIILKNFIKAGTRLTQRFTPLE